MMFWCLWQRTRHLFPYRRPTGQAMEFHFSITWEKVPFAVPEGRQYLKLGTQSFALQQRSMATWLPFSVASSIWGCWLILPNIRLSRYFGGWAKLDSRKLHYISTICVQGTHHCHTVHPSLYIKIIHRTYPFLCWQSCQPHKLLGLLPSRNQHFVIRKDQAAN